MRSSALAECQSMASEVDNSYKDSSLGSCGGDYAEEFLYQCWQSRAQYFKRSNLNIQVAKDTVLKRWLECLWTEFILLVWIHFTGAEIKTISSHLPAINSMFPIELTLHFKLLHCCRIKSCSKIITIPNGLAGEIKICHTFNLLKFRFWVSTVTKLLSGEEF